MQRNAQIHKYVQKHQLITCADGSVEKYDRPLSAPFLFLHLSLGFSQSSWLDWEREKMPVTQKLFPLTF